MKVWECRLLRERDLSSHPRPEAVSERAFGTSKLQEASLKKKKKVFIYLFWLHQVLVVGVKDLLVAMLTLRCDR